VLFIIASNTLIFSLFQKELSKRAAFVGFDEFWILESASCNGVFKINSSFRQKVGNKNFNLMSEKKTSVL